ncbi:bacterioferritin [Xanthomonas oryzae pv. oryzae]|nr:bacterioferritin [Xanthomonas oryzae pv. oryzae]UXV78703.1 bacterioferritin [Xanthomonas oryzae pv. oryzae]
MHACLGHHARIASLEHTMKGHPEVVDYLKQLLRGELAARDQYFLHSRRYEDQGLMALYERINHEMEEETEHADALLRRILFLEGDPDMRPAEFAPGKTVVEMLERDLVVEYEVRAALAAGMKLCEDHGDYVSRDTLLKQLQDTEEDHAWWLEQQLGLIKRIGLELYQTSKIDKGHAAG